MKKTLVLVGNWETVCKKVYERAQELISKYRIKPTLRSLFYWAADAEGLIVHSQVAYKKLSENFRKWREKHGCLDILEDRTRKIVRYDNRELKDLKATVRRSIQRLVKWLREESWKVPRWYGQVTHVELWVEKETITLVDLIARELQVDVFPTRGFSSATKLFEAAQYLGKHQRLNIVLILTDWDPSGWQIAKTYEEKAKQYGASAYFEVIAVLPEQIEKYELPTIPPDDPSFKRILRDSRAKAWVEYCATWGLDPKPVELDAFAGLRPQEFKDLIAEKVDSLFDKKTHDEVKKLEPKRKQEAEELATKLEELLKQSK